MHAAVYWGSFDPFTLAHQEIINQFLDTVYVNELLLVINNDERKNYLAPLNDRIKMINLGLLANNFRHIKDKIYQKENSVIKILIQQAVGELSYEKLKNEREHLAVIAGMDSFLDWCKSTPLEKIKTFDQLYIVPRADFDLPRSLLESKNLELLPIKEEYRNVSSKKSREGINVAKTIAVDVLDYIHKNNLYLQP